MWRVTSALAVLAMLGAVASDRAGASKAPVAGWYVVVLKPDSADVPATAVGLSRAHGGELGVVYRHALRGFSVRVSAQGAAGIARSPHVAYVEPDQEITVSAQTAPTGVRRVFAQANPELDIDDRDDVRVDVDVAVIDTGIDLDHPDLDVVGGTSCVNAFASCGSGGDDGHGHGRHVAGTIAAIDDGAGVVGIAPGARLWAVRVLNSKGSGTTSQVVAGIDWVAARAATIEVANLSLGGSASQALDDAANGLAEAGVAVAVAAGNSAADASTSSPARAVKVLTVSALADFDGQAGGGAASTCRTDQDDTLASFSNWGSAVELAAPGVCILSTWPNGGMSTLSGTSMASPHAAGALALLASRGFTRSWTGVAGLYATLQENGNLGWTDDSGDGVKEPLLDLSNASVFDPVVTDGAGGGDGDDSTPPAAPTGLTATAGDASVSLDWADNAEPDLAGYAGYRDTTGGGPYTRVNVPIQFPSSYVDATVENGTTYHYVVRALDTSNNESTSSGEASATPTALSRPSVSLSGSGQGGRSSWIATVTIAVTRYGAPLAATVVAGSWSNGATGTGSCTTGTAGTCTVAKSGIAKRTGSVRYTVTTVAGSSGFDGTSSITVARP
jgi:hypothetical protein